MSEINDDDDDDDDDNAVTVMYSLVSSLRRLGNPNRLQCCAQGRRQGV